MKELKVTLDYPITQSGKKVKSLTLKRPNIGQLRGLELEKLLQMNASEWVRFLPLVCSELEMSVEQLDPADFLHIMKTAGTHFFIRTSEQDAPLMP